MEVEFYRSDSYLNIRRKFTGAWGNLRLELHRQSNRFWKEGDDEFEDDTQFFHSELSNELLFTLTGDTTKAAARRLFSDYYSYRGLPGDYLEAFIYGNFADEISYPQNDTALDECNNPFMLPLNQFAYAEFKRRFTERWTNLSIEVYQSETPNGDLTPDSAELPDDFEMKNLTRVNRLVRNEFYERGGVRCSVEKLANESVLRDEIYLSDFGNTLKNSGINFRIKNKRLGIYWSRNLKQARLQDFQDALSA